LHPQPPPQHAPGIGADSAVAPVPDDFAGALKTESCNVWRRLEHFGQEMACPRESTICS
jgi:hypothetical protein